MMKSMFLKFLTKTNLLWSLIYIDLHPRPTKRSGAWMSSIKDNGLSKGEIQRPHVQFM